MRHHPSRHQTLPIYHAPKSLGTRSAQPVITRFDYREDGACALCKTAQVCRPFLELRATPESDTSRNTVRMRMDQGIAWSARSAI